MENVTNVAKPTNVKKIALGGSLGLALVLGVVGFMAPQPKATIAKTPETQNVDAKQTKESLDDAFKLDFNHGLSKTVAKEASSPLISTPTHAHQNHIIPSAPSAAPDPVAKTAICGQMDPTIAGEIRDWQKNFTISKLNSSLGNYIPPKAKAKFVNIINKRQLVDGVIYYLETTPKFKASLKSEIANLKAAGDDEEAISVILLGLVPKLNGAINQNVVQFLLDVFKGEHGWDTITEHAKAKGIKLTLTYSKDCNKKHVVRKSTLSKNALKKPVIKKSTVTCDHPVPELIQKKLDHWVENFTSANVEAQVGTELTKEIKDKITKVRNKKDLLTVVFSFLENEPSVNTNAMVVKWLPELKKALANGDETTIAKDLPNIAGPLMAHYQKTVVFVISTLQMNAQHPNNPAWDEIRDYAASHNFGLAYDYKKLQNCTSKQLPAKWLDKIDHWRANFTHANVDKQIGTELSADVKAKIEKVRNKKDLLTVVFDFLENEPSVNTNAMVVKWLPELKKALANGDETTIAKDLPNIAGPLMPHYQKTVIFVISTLQMNAQHPDNPAWDEIRDAAASDHVNIEYNFVG